MSEEIIKYDLDQTLIKISEIEQNLVKIKKIEEGMEFYAKVCALQEYARKKKWGRAAQIPLTIVALKNERINGQILIEMWDKDERSKGGRPRINESPSETCLSKLKDFGISKQQSLRWQFLTYIPDEVFLRDTDRWRAPNWEKIIGLIVKETFYSGGRKYKRELEKIEQPKIIKPVVYNIDYSVFLAKFEDKSVDLLLTDPPYMTEFETEDEFKKFVQTWVPLSLSKIKDTGRVYIFTGNYPREVHTYLSVLLDQDEFVLSNILVWGYYNTIGPAPKMKYKQSWNAVFYLYGKTAAGLDCPKLKELFDVQNIPAPDGRVKIRYSTFEKPEEVARRFISHSTKEGDLMIDLFAGTGTFLLAAGALGRQAFGCDVDKKMIEICKKRGV